MQAAAQAVAERALQEVVARTFQNGAPAGVGSPQGTVPSSSGRTKGSLYPHGSNGAAIMGGTADEDSIQLMDVFHSYTMRGAHINGPTGGAQPDPQELHDVLQDEKNMILQLLSQQSQNSTDDALVHAASATGPQHLQFADASLNMRPDKHYFTISANGAILEATNTVTGFAPDTLLMTSAYDTVFDEDLPGFLCVKHHCWDKGIPDVDVYIRRRTMEGEWIWLRSRAVGYLHDPVEAITIEESFVHDEFMAQQLNRMIRITAILIQAVEAARLTEQKSDLNLEISSHPIESVPAKDVESFQSMLDTMMASGVEFPGSGEMLQDLAQMAAQGASGRVRNGMRDGASDLDLDTSNGGQKKPFEPFSMMEFVRQGVRVDLGLLCLQPDEVNLVTLVLSGRWSVDHVIAVVGHALQTGNSLKWALNMVDSDVSESSKGPRVPLPNGSRHGHESTPGRSIAPPPPPISVINLSYTYVGNSGIETFSKILYQDGSLLKTLDVSFCAIKERGLLALARAIARRKKKGIAPLRGLILSGNNFNPRSASEIGASLSPATRDDRRGKTRVRKPGRRTGYDSDSNDSEDDDEDEEDGDIGKTSKRPRLHVDNSESNQGKCCSKERGLRLLHVASASLIAESMSRLLEGLGMHSSLRELNLSSNNLGASGAEALAKFFESKNRSCKHAVMPFLDRLDMSNNNLGDDGTTQLTRAISKRHSIHLVDLRLSSNAIGAGGIETIMNKLLQHNLISLSLDKNTIGDQGCQLVAASLQSMKALSLLNLGFNQIGSRGITSLMRSLVTCESITYLGLSGNILRISGAISLAFALAQHPRLEELDLDNCCLSQAAQCHIVAGIISNRWVPMKRLKGFAVGPPMAAIGALESMASTLSNEECFRIRKDEQMKTILQWMESNRIAKKKGGKSKSTPETDSTSDLHGSRFLSPEVVESINDVQGTPSQHAYLRLLGWLGRIPFDEDELTALQKYFYDVDGGEGDRGSDGYINLKLRGDLLAALDSGVAEEMREEFPSLASALVGTVGLDLDKLFEDNLESCNDIVVRDPETADTSASLPIDILETQANDGNVDSAASLPSGKGVEEESNHKSASESDLKKESFDSSRDSMVHTESGASVSGKEKKSNKVKARITMFPQFEQHLDELKATATEMIEQEDDPNQHEVILTQYAEASLTILRQLKYYCMNSGLDGWRKGGLKRKVLVVDDSKVTRKMVSREFEKANFIVDTASNGAEGVEKLKASIYDIAFMDIDMPVMNGLEATKKLREWEDAMRPGARQPICALTAAYVDDFDKSELMKFKEAGLDVMESKPCNMPRLFKVVDDVSPMFSDLSISVIQRERSDCRLSD